MMACSISKPLPGYGLNLNDSARPSYTLYNNKINSNKNIPSHISPFKGLVHYKGVRKDIQSFTIQCMLTITKDSSSSLSRSLEKEPHKYFDNVVITVRSGDGGHGAVLSMPKPWKQEKSPGKRKKETGKPSSYKRDSDGNLILPMGGHGGDILLYADESKDSLLDFHQTNKFNGKRGGNVDAMGRLAPNLHDGLAAPTVRIPVPVGTVVKRKRGGQLLADLARPGDKVLVARGGRGGISLVDTPQRSRSLMKALNTNVMKSENDKDLILGQPGEEVRLELILRIVADVGLVGLPNAGKSSLLAAVTLAKPEIANYPFTTLIPNLGRLDGDPSLGVWGYSSNATLADLPGLIHGAHLGKGLGRNFLRHLRRTRLLVHVVDASTEDPVEDYRTLREELCMYNPQYIERPHMVILNKLDIPEARDRFDVVSEHIAGIGSLKDIRGSHEIMEEETSVGELSVAQHPNDKSVVAENEVEDCSYPLAVIGISALQRIGIDKMLKEIRLILKALEEKNNKQFTNNASKSIPYKPAEYQTRLMGRTCK